MAQQVFNVTPPGKLTRRQRKDLRQQVARLQQARDGQDTTDRDARFPAAAAGPLGPGISTGEYWNWMQLAQPPHQATSHNLAGIYPFVADDGLGHEGPLLGVDLNADVLWHFSPWDLYMNTTAKAALSTNILVIGAYRSGKSGTIKQLCTRSLAFGHQVVVPSDSKGEWVIVAEAVGGQVIAIGGENTTARLNPLDRGPRQTGVSDDVDEIMVRDRRRATLTSVIEATIQGQAKLSPMEHTSINWALEHAITVTHDRPTITHVWQALVSPDQSAAGYRPEMAANGERARHVLGRFVAGDLQGLFDGESTVAFDPEAPMVVVDTSALFDRSELAAQLTQICTSSWIQAVISDRSAKRTRYLVREEGWRDMATEQALRTYQQWLKLSRHYGVSNIVILHKMSDFDAVGEEGSKERTLAYSIAGDMENKFIFRQNTQEEHNLTARLKLTPAHARLSLTLQSGVFLAYVGRFSYIVDAFATSTQWERDLFTTDEAVEAGSASDQPVPALVPDSDEPLFDESALDRLWPTCDHQLVQQIGHRE
ncbi:hypothetical protein E3T55_19690 [Cryobacterium frigoriphilum]|uniref:ATP-binding protein n=1 Tax=Cryobacterium frigoriphilum TaxID=1259150 RepID=A0A4R8ZTA4_9MICO|nr:hypothetical protein [Cryobacterium frigoriphilum]TFD45018.1 hypothetical protein E3T55_19690 [Cryobacterium frigoriphilum]